MSRHLCTGKSKADRCLHRWLSPETVCLLLSIPNYTHHRKRRQRCVSVFPQPTNNNLSGRANYFVQCQMTVLFPALYGVLENRNAFLLFTAYLHSPDYVKTSSSLMRLLEQNNPGGLNNFGTRFQAVLFRYAARACYPGLFFSVLSEEVFENGNHIGCTALNVRTPWTARFPV